MDLSEPLEPDFKQSELYTACPLRIKKQLNFKQRTDQPQGQRQAEAGETVGVLKVLPLCFRCPRLPTAQALRRTHTGAAQTEQPEPGSTLPPVRDEQYPKAPARGGLGTTKPSDHGEPVARSQHRLPGRPRIPTPPPAPTFPTTDTIRARARGGARGLPRRVPWRPRNPRKTSAQKGAPKTPARGACCPFPPNCSLPSPSVDSGTPTRTTPPPTGESSGAHPAPCICGLTKGQTPL